jgi:centromere-localized protein 2
LKSIIPDLERAAEEVEDEIRRLEEEAETLLEEMKGTVGGLSDLRYGRLANGQLREQVLEGLGRLEGSCHQR